MTLREHCRIISRSLRLLYRLSRRYVLALMLGAAVTALLPYVPIYFSARLIDALTAGAGVRTLALYAGLTVGLTALLTLCKALLEAQTERGKLELDDAHEWQFAEKAMHLAYASIEDRQTALLAERIYTESRTGFNLFYFAGCLNRAVRCIVQVVASVSLTVSFFAVRAIPLWAKLAFAGGVALTLAANMFVSKRSTQLNNAYAASCTQSNITLDRFFTYISHYTTGKDIRLYGMAGPLGAFERRFYDEVSVREAKCTLQCSALKLLSTGMEYLLRGGVYLLLIAGALQGGLSVGSIAQYVSSVVLLLTGAVGLVRVTQILALNDTYTKRYFSYFDILNPMYQGTLSVEKRDDNDYTIEFCDVSFRYPNTESYALRHVSLKFKIGQRLAVVGRNGSGKTTFIKLLCRLYDPTEGVILLNGVDIRKYDYEEYLALFSVVFQDFRLFAFPLGQNVAAGAAYDRVRAADCLTEAGFGERLSAMPQGLDTALYQNFDPAGVEISGGEAQKIALARALYKDAPFIILDEPTAALDPVSEYEVYRKFSDISGGKTAVYISHRLASCRFCDKIAVFADGQIVQTGTHETLLAETGRPYAALWNAQAQYYTAADEA